MGVRPVDGPVEVLGAHDVGHQSHLDTKALGLADVVDDSGEGGRSGTGLVEEQVVGLVPIDVDATADAAIKEAEVETEVERRGLLPGQVLVGHVAGHLAGHVGRAEEIVVGVGAQGCERRVGIDGGVTGETP